MKNIIWKTPEAEDIKKMTLILNSSEFMGSDLSYANMFLLKEKYDIKICFYKNFLLRKYNGLKSNRKGFGFPIGKGDLKEIFSLLRQDARAYNYPYEFCLLTDKQVKAVKALNNGKFDIEIDEGDGDYIYLQSDLAELKGKKFQKKRNHISKFTSLYNDFHFENITVQNMQDVIDINNNWFEQNADFDNFERKAILNALEYYSELKLNGIILYVGNVPVAFTIASAINKDVCDVHYEKALKKFANDGAYSVINKVFSEKMYTYKFINREEDLGIEGLRKAKRSYHPYMILYKYCLREK